MSTPRTSPQEADGSATKVETVLTERQAARLAAKGVKLEVKRIGGKAASQVLREQAAAGLDAFRSYSEPGGIRDEIAAVAARYPMLTKVVTIGTDCPGQADSRGQGHQERQAGRATAPARPPRTWARSTPGSGSRSK